MSNQNTTIKSETDWTKIDAMSDEDIGYSDIPPITDEMRAKGVWRKGLKTNTSNGQETLSIDREVIEFFKAQGRDYQTKINQILRAYMEAHQAK
ncbi:MAG: BrnA antitoxin family protein [Pyrinomonadaceae bacterium]